MNLHIHNIRLGKACNSSSTHSLIVVTDNNLDRIHENGDISEGTFVTKDPGVKNLYAAHSVHSSLYGMFSGETANFIAKKITGAEYEGDICDCVYIEDTIMMPFSFNSGKLHRNFVKDYVKFLSGNNVVILGGRDDGNAYYDNKDIGKEVFDQKYYGGGWIAREDKKYGYFSLFSPRNGIKIRMSFDTPIDWEPEKSTYPELVDIKITDYCDVGCSWCYQNSTKDGKHAPKEKVFKILDELAAMEVFEIALGGGEPTKHPDFVEILHYARKLGIEPNFTTQSLEWVENEDILSGVQEYAGAIAFSINSLDFVNKIDAVKVKQQRYGDRLQLVGQIVTGVVSDNEILNISNALNERFDTVTLLGYKETGRGSSFKPVNNDIPHLLNSIRGKNISIDTKLAADYKEELEASDIASWLYNVEEGKFSMYIDAVSMEAAPSSYCDKSEYIKIGQTDNLFNEITLAFEEF